MVEGEYLAPGERGGFLAKAARRFGALFGGPTAADLDPRKVAATVEQRQNIVNLRHETGQEQDVKERRFVVSPRQMRALADQDDIIFSIRRTLKNAIRELPWKIVPDMGGIKDDLERLSTTVAINLAIPTMKLEFQPQAISNELYVKALGPLQDLVFDLIFTEKIQPERLSDSPRYRQFFENLLAAHETIARSHVQQVQAIFERPNPSAESSYESLLNLLIDDITLFDAGVLVKNTTKEGKLGELYTIPGETIRIYRNKDKSTPQPPYIAYDEIVEGQIQALYNNAELVYMMTNPQNNGYGKSPMDCIIEQMIGTRYADAYLIDWYQNNNMPFFVFDLGPDVDQGERDAVERAWDQRVSKGKHRGIFIANKDGVKGFMPLPPTTNKDMEVLEQLKFWANRKCAAFGLSLNDIGFTEDLHRTTAETQADLTQSRGIESMARVIAAYNNGEIVKGAMWVRDDPDNPNSLAGQMKPCFPFRDVKFAFFPDESESQLRKAQEMATLVSGGISTINEAREELGKKPLPGGDEAVCFSAGLVRVRDLPDLPGPQQQQAMQEPTGDPGADPSQQQQPPQPALPPGQGQLGKSLNQVDALVDRLAKLAEG